MFIIDISDSSVGFEREEKKKVEGFSPEGTGCAVCSPWLMSYPRCAHTCETRSFSTTYTRQVLASRAMFSFPVVALWKIHRLLQRTLVMRWLARPLARHVAQRLCPADGGRRRDVSARDAVAWYLSRGIRGCRCTHNSHDTIILFIVLLVLSELCVFGSIKMSSLHTLQSTTQRV